MSTPYAELPPTEKESDREQASRYLPTIEDALLQALGTTGSDQFDT
jgi:hypothetical protein